VGEGREEASEGFWVSQEEIEEGEVEGLLSGEVGNVITRAIGIYEDPELEMENGALEPGDAFVICSDGLFAHVLEDEIRDSVVSGGSQDACDALVALTLQRGAVGTANAGQGDKRGQATVTLVDNQGAPVGSALVGAAFTGDFTENQSGSTSASGSVTLTTTASKKGKVSFTFCVSGVTASGLTYDPASNAQTCASL
jgi:hypothetical protein